MTDRSAALDLLKRALASDAATFRDGQWEAIDALVNKQERLLVVQRTGGERAPSILLQRESYATANVARP